MTVVDHHTVRLTSKKDGKVVSEEKSTVGSDGTMLTEEFTQFPPAGEPVKGKLVSQRVRKGACRLARPVGFLARVQGRRVL